MLRPFTVFVSLVLVFEIIPMGCTACAQSPKTMTNSIGMQLVLIPKGTFRMGSPPFEKYSDEQEKQHEVTITNDYYLGAFEVTQSQYLKVMGQNPSYFQGEKVAERHPQTGLLVKEVDSSSYPVEQVSWDMAVEFCKELSSLPEEKKAGRVYRLPTEAEWEYACRAGSKYAFSFGEKRRLLGDYAWFESNSNSQTHSVGEKKANAWGLYDVHGNVNEWCSDWLGVYPEGSVSDPTGPARGWGRVYRGGSWLSEVGTCRSAARDMNPASWRNDRTGFRIALSSSEISK